MINSHPVTQVHDLITSLLKEINQVEYIELFEKREDRFIKKLIPIVKRYVREQKKELLKRFDNDIKPLLQESNVTNLVEATIRSEWLALWEEVVEVTKDILIEPLEEAGETIFREEYNTLLDLLGFEGGSPISFDIVNQRAINFFNPEKTIKNISDTTQDSIRRLVNTAVEEGLSYTQLSKNISTMFSEFNTDKDKNGRTRADRIAINEIRERNSGSGQIVANELKNKGFTIEKRWITRGDNKVRPEHTENEEQGYIPVKDNYQSGDLRPPTDPNCRCVQTYRSVI